MSQTPSTTCPPTPAITHACQGCGQPFVAIPIVLNGRVIYPKRYCDPCVQRRDEAQVLDQKQRQAAHLAEAWERICPPIYRDSDQSRLPCALATREAVLRWEFKPQGLLLYGPTSSGKSRLAFLLLSRLHHLEARKVAAIASTAFSHQVSALFGEGGGKGEAFIDRLANVEVLLIDDIGKGRLTDRVEAEFFHIIEHRASHLLPTILTTNLSGDALTAAWSPDRADPLVRRLIEFFQVILVSPAL